MKIYIILILYFSINLLSQENLSRSKAYEKLKTYQKLYIDGDINASILSVKKIDRSYKDDYNLAFLLFMNSEYVAALELINELIRKKQTYYVYQLKGKIYNAINEHYLAIKSFEKSYSMNDSNPLTIFELGKGYYNNKQFDKAIKYFDEALDENDKHSLSIIFKAKSYIALNNYIEAKKILVNGLEDAFPEEDYLIILSEIYRHENNTNDQIKSLVSYLNLYPVGIYSNQAKSQLESLSVNYTFYTPIKNMTANYKLKPKEHLKYIVSYGFDIGEMLINVGEDTVIVDGKKTFYVSYNLRSTTFLISLVSHFESYINLENLNTMRSYLTNKEGDKIDQKVYIFDHKNHTFKARIVNYDHLFEYVEKDMPINAQDGTSILYFSRGMVANQINGKITTVISEEFSTTEIINKSQRKETLFDKSDTFYFIEANANYKGVAGMNGEALGYFTQDENYIPAIGKLKIILGSVRVELKERSY